MGMLGLGCCRFFEVASIPARSGWKARRNAVGRLLGSRTTRSLQLQSIHRLRVRSGCFFRSTGRKMNRNTLKPSLNQLYRRAGSRTKNFLIKCQSPALKRALKSQATSSY
jgi:hypothetical protein